MQNIIKLKNKKHFKTLFVSIFVAASLISWVGIKIYDSHYVSTDDAYVNANVVQIAPQISGMVIQTMINDNQYVKQNQQLFAIDPKPFKIAVAKAEAQLAINQAALINARTKSDRINRLAQKQLISSQERDNVRTNLETAESSVKLAQATLEQAKLNLSWANITAPASGWITNLRLRTGDLVTVNQPLFALISDGEFWIDANFKETQLLAIKPGQTATIKVDMYPNFVFQGVVESISGGTGSAFSLLPPQNATGNWVKVTQRVPVRIRVLNPDHKYPLRIGTSASVSVSLQKFYR